MPIAPACSGGDSIQALSSSVMRIAFRTTPALLLVLFAALACASGSRAQSAATRARVSDTSANSQHTYTAADIHFMDGMISHHAQALVMAGWAASHGASPSVLTLTARITNAQQDEIAGMQMAPRSPPAGARSEPARDDDEDGRHGARWQHQAGSV